MFKSNSTRRGHEKYEKLDKESGGHNETSNEEYLKRSTSVPSGPSNIKTNMAMASTLGDINLQRKQVVIIRRRVLLIHFSISLIFGERYVEYLKEGGMWDSNSNKPVIYYK